MRRAGRIVLGIDSPTVSVFDLDSSLFWLPGPATSATWLNVQYGTRGYLRNFYLASVIRLRWFKIELRIIELALLLSLSIDKIEVVTRETVTFLFW
jgi:hypothetical protein